MIDSEKQPTVYIPLQLKNESGVSMLHDSLRNSGKGTDDVVTDQRILLIDQTYENDVPIISLSSSVKVALAVILTLSILIGTFFKCIMYLFVFTTNKQNHGMMHRPINVLTVTSAIVHHVTHGSLGVWYILVLLTDSPLMEIFGYESCLSMYYIGTYGLAYLIIGGLGIAVYRLFYLNHEYLVKHVVGERVLMWILLISSFSISGLIVLVFVVEDKADRSALNMCTGISNSQMAIMIDYSMSLGNEDFEASFGFDKVVFGVLIVFQAIEFTICIWIFCLRYKHDNGDITKYLRQEDIRLRNLKNVTTFIGQFYGFGIEFAFLISMILLAHFTESYDPNVRGLVVLAKFIEFGFLSFVEVFSSPGLRNFIKKWY